VVTTADMWDEFMKRPSIECLGLFRSEYMKSGALPDLYNHNLVVLDIGDWEEAKRNCAKIINDQKFTCEADFINMGMIEWFLGDTSSAIDFWQQSMHTDYAACPGAPDGPLLLWYAGQRLGDEKLVTKSLKKLRRYWKVSDYRVFSGWMGTVAIAGFLMDKVPADVFLHEWKDEEKGPLEDRRMCRANFWAGMKCLVEGKESTAALYFKSAFSRSKMAIGEYEYFLAKWEYSNIKEPLNSGLG